MINRVGLNGLTVVVTIVLNAFWTSIVFAGKLEPGAGRFEFAHGGKSIPVWYFLPEEATTDVAVLFVMHGVNRDADRYRNEWIPYAKQYGFILAAPEFSNASFPDEAKYNLGNTFDEKGRPVPREEWTFAFLEPIFDEIKRLTGNRSKQFHLYGHSAGAQFVHRYLYFMPEARVGNVVAANAGWWTMPDPTADFPYGLNHSGVEAAALKAMLQKPLVVLLGTADTDPNHRNLRRTPEAMAQGPHRFARGQSFYRAGRERATALGIPFHWRLATAPDVGHSDKGMAEYAVVELFGAPGIR